MATVLTALTAKKLKKQGIAYSLPGVRQGAQAVDKRTELAHHLVDLIEDQSGEFAVTGTDSLTAMYIVVLNLEEELTFEAPGAGRKAAVYDISAIFEITNNNPSALSLHLHVGPALNAYEAGIGFSWGTSIGENALAHLSGKLFVRPDTETTGDLRVSWMGTWGSSDGTTIAMGETGPDDPLHEQAWDAEGELFLWLGAKFAASDAGQVTLRQFAMTRIH